MINKGSASKILSFFLLFALSFSAVASIGAQQQQRERRVTGPAAPAAAVLPAASTGAPRTLEELRARIQEVTHHPELDAAQIAVKVASLDTGRTLYEENAGKLLKPASNMKLYTWAAALDRLSPDYHFKTSVYAPAPPDAVGIVRGDMIVYGRGDPSFAARFNDGDYNKAFDELAARIAAAGVRRVEGDLVGDESYFNGAPPGSGWEWDDLQWWYGAEVSALTVNDNSIDLFIKPGATIGAPCTVRTGPPTPLVTITNHTTTTPRSTKSELSVYRGLGENVLEIGGSLPLDGREYSESVAVPHPALMFVYMLRSSLAQRGVTITGRSRTIDAHERVNIPLQTNSLVEIASQLSPPLSAIAAKTLKPSQNLYTELILRTLGKVAGGNSKLSNEDAGLEVVKTFLREAGVETNRVFMTDGSGLSRNDLVTANTSVQLLTYMSRHRYANAFREALPIAGVDGTLSNRMKGTVAAGNVRAKTGSLNGVATLSGYVTSAAGEHLVFSIIVNNYTEELDARHSYLDAIAVLLASFTGRS